MSCIDSNTIQFKPLLVKQIVNAICLNKEDCNIMPNLDFVLEDIGQIYKDGDPICLQKTYISYDNIGILTENINAQIASESISLTGSNPLDNLYNNYTGTIPPICNCCKDNTGYICRKLYEQNLQIYVENLVITIQGTIGCAPFQASYRYSGMINNVQPFV